MKASMTKSTLRLFTLCLLLSTANVSCANREKKNDSAKSDTTPMSSPAQITNPAPQQAHASADHGAVKSHRHAGEVPADKALGWLVNGNTRYRSGKFRSDGAKAADRERLSSGQKPHTIVLSCSDSRVPPEVVFDQKLGEIFVIRTAGESLDNAAIASIEYAISHLGPNLIVVMGHESCGAVKATLTTPVNGSAGSPALDALVNDLRPHMSSHIGKNPSNNYVDESWSNVHGVTKDLLQKSQIIRDAVLTGEVKIKAALYYLKSGEVEWSKEKF